MRKVELTKGIYSSALGFGCASILGAVDAKTAKQAVYFALDQGINHFDLARSYGYGEAERFVGSLIKEKRHELVLASKFGIKANWKSSMLKSVKPLIRMLRKDKNTGIVESAFPSTTKVPSIADHFLDRIVPLRSKDMRISLEKSLKELRSDYLDYLFVHEPIQELSHFEELQETAEMLKAEGKIRAWGLAFMQSQVLLHRSYFHAFDLLQFDRPMERDVYEKLVVNRGLKSNIIFSPIRAGSKSIRPTEKLRKLMDDFPNTVVLSSMFNLKHLKENVQAVG